MRRPFYTIQPITHPKGLVIKSSFEHVGSIRLSDSDMEQWPKEAVFCHNDLTLRNLILQSSLLLKERMMDIAPPSPSQADLLRAMELIFESEQRRLSEGTNMPAHVRKRFREVLRLTRDEHPYVGWKCETKGASLPKFSRDDAQKLEGDVVAEMIGRRQAKARPH